MGFITPDGADLVGGKLPSGVGQAFLLDSLGNLLVSLQDPALAQITNGQAFFGTTGQETLANATVDSPCSLFNPANSGKNVLITSWEVSSGTGALIGFMYFVTTDPAYANSLLISNAKAGGAASVASGTFINTNQSAPGGGTQFRRIFNNNYQQMIPNGFGILLPKGVANGVVTMMETYATGGIGGQSMGWLEF
jgi:hypothetical protein